MRKYFISIAVFGSMIFGIGFITPDDTYAGEIKNRWYHGDTRDGVSLTMAGNSTIDLGIVSGSYDVSARTMLNCGNVKVEKITNIFRIEGWRFGSSDGVFGKVYDRTFTSFSSTRECLLSIQQGYGGPITIFFTEFQYIRIKDLGLLKYLPRRLSRCSEHGEEQ